MIASLDARLSTRRPPIAPLPAVQFDPSAAFSWNLNAVKADVAQKTGWPEEFLDRVAGEYRKFIFVASVYPDQNLPMGGAIDEFWHHHLLDTRAYSEFCQGVAGRFIHHRPGRGAEGQGSIRRTINLVESTVGAIDEAVWLALGLDDAICDADPCSSCDRLAN